MVRVCAYVAYIGGELSIVGTSKESMRTYMQNQTVQREQMVIGGNTYRCNPHWHKSELRPTIWLHTRNLDVLAEGGCHFLVHKVNNRND